MVILNSFLTQSVLVLEIALTQMQDLALVLIELHDPHISPSLKSAKSPLDGISSLRCVKCTTIFMKILTSIGPNTHPWSLSH